MRGLRKAVFVKRRRLLGAARERRQPDDDDDVDDYQCCEWPDVDNDSDADARRNYIAGQRARGVNTCMRGCDDSDDSDDVDGIKHGNVDDIDDHDEHGDSVRGTTARDAFDHVEVAELDGSERTVNQRDNKLRQRV